jgi:hypothetical protein
MAPNGVLAEPKVNCPVEALKFSVGAVTKPVKVGEFIGAKLS